MVVVVNTHLALLHIEKLEVYILIHLLHLLKTWVRRAVGQHKAVAAEVLVVRVHPRTEVTAIGPIVAAVTTYGVDALIDPIPDKAALHMLTKRHNIEILAEVAR